MSCVRTLFYAAANVGVMRNVRGFRNSSLGGDAAVKAIRNLRNIYALLFGINILLTAWFIIKSIPDGAVVFGASGTVILVRLFIQNNRLSVATLIRDNSILSVPSAMLSTANGKGKISVEETVVSTFGILVGSKIYKWGCDGVYGVRLKAIEIDRARIYLTFGDGAETMQVELLHGMGNEQEVMDVKQRLLRETGVTAMISGW
jgi:hypothetical protein